MLKKFVAIILTLSMLTGMFTTVHATETTKYIKEIKLGSKADLEDAGYIVFNYDLNTGTGKGEVYIGYIETYDPAEAITDIRALEEGKDYQLVNADALNSEFFAADAMADAVDLMKAVEEFRKLYKAGVYAAQFAYHIMQTYAYSGNERLGDYILNDAAEDTLSLISLSASDDMKYGLYCALFMGLRDSDTATWQQRMIYTEGEIIEEDDYLSMARSMLVAVKSFRVQMNEALNKKYASNEQMDVTLLSAKEVLESYSYGETDLFDYFMNNELSSELLLPLAAVLSENEINLMKFIGFANFCYMQDGTTTEELVESAKDAAKKTEPIDFWKDSIAGDSGKIAVTSDAIRDMATNDEARVTRISDASIGLGIAAGVSLLMLSITWIGSRIAQNSNALINFTKEIRAFKVEGVLNPTPALQLERALSAARNANFYETGTTSFISASKGLTEEAVAFATSSKAAGMTTKSLSVSKVTAASKALSGAAKATIVLTVVFCVLDIIFLGIDISGHEDVEHDEKPSRALSLEKMADGEYGYVEYKTVDFVEGGIGDTNNNEARKWMLLLTTKDMRMGNPIKAGSLKLSKNKDASGNSPVSILGQYTAADLNANAFTHKNANYLFFSRGDADLLASVFTTPHGKFLISSIVILVAACITIPIIIKKKRKSNT